MNVRYRVELCSMTILPRPMQVAGGLRSRLSGCCGRFCSKHSRRSGQYRG